MRNIIAPVALATVIAFGSPANVLAADLENGRSLFESDCANCHTLRKDAEEKRGPHLEDLFARKYGAVEDFEYRMVWTTADPTWTPEELDAYLNIHGRYAKTGRADLIGYLKEATRPTP